jgi:23S rRNA G2069 N7-methylase RlmK/C1962 C5-methylase RlmI
LINDTRGLDDKDCDDGARDAERQEGKNGCGRAEEADEAGVVVVVYGGWVVRRWEEEGYQREYNDEAAEAAADAVEDEGYVNQNVDGSNTVSELLGPLDVGEIEVEGAELEFTVDGVC